MPDTRDIRPFEDAPLEDLAGLIDIIADAIVRDLLAYEESASCIADRKQDPATKSETPVA